jgi:hypothetical protein
MRSAILRSEICVVGRREGRGDDLVQHFAFSVETRAPYHFSS